MAKLQLYRKVKSLAWRRRMVKNLEGLESEIMGYMLAKCISNIIVAGYSVRLIGEKLVLEKLPFVDSKQLKFNFAQKEGRRKPWR